jgi:hypothetical protein
MTFCPIRASACVRGAWSALAKGGRKPNLDIVRRHSPGSHSTALQQRIFSAVVRMVSTMAARNAAMFAAHDARKQSSAALRKGVLVM